MCLYVDNAEVGLEAAILVKESVIAQASMSYECAENVTELKSTTEVMDKCASWIFIMDFYNGFL